jgi:type IV pilus assembly protein PilC
MARAVEVPKKQQKPVTYRYEAYDRQGKLVKGTIKATSEVEAERLIVNRGQNPLQVILAPSMFSLEEALPTLFRVKPRDVIIFSRQLATLLRSGISLLPALEILQGQVATSRAFRKILESITYDLRAGVSFAQALNKHPTAFDEVYCRTVAVGEQAGNLEDVLHRVADFMERQGEATKKASKALVYPAMVMGVGLVVVVVLMTVVMPQLLGMFTAMNVELPLPTKILIGVVNVFTSYPLYFLVGGVVIAVVILWLVKQPTGRRILDRIRLTAPIIGPPTLMGELARFTRTMSVMLAAGVSLQEAMDMMPQSTNNRVVRDALEDVKSGLLLGEGLSGPMSRMDLFPPLLVQMVAVGEETNSLDFSLGVVADFYETTADEKISAVVGMIGPVSTIVIALAVGFIAIAVLMPMYTLTGAFG